MPTYEYECSAGHRYEKREGFDAPATQRCAKCRRLARRVLQSPPILFKGSGFYVTDSRKPVPAGESEAKAESESKVESTSAPTDGDAGTKKETKKDVEPAAAS